MSEHTPEPWEVLDGKIIGNVSVDRLARYLVADCGWYPRGKSDARRIVACVNACRGIPMDILESTAGLGAEDIALAVWVGNQITERERLTKQFELADRFAQSCVRERDEARAMVAELGNMLDSIRSSLIDDSNRDSWWDPTVSDIDKAIAKAKALHV